MWEAYGLQNEDLLWLGTAFRGGIAGVQEAPCGAVSGATMALGLRHMTGRADKAKMEIADKAIYTEAEWLVKSFKEKFGSITCIGLLGLDLSDEASLKIARESGVFNDKCPRHVLYAIEKLYELEDKRGQPR